MLAAISKNLEGVHMGFLRQVTGNASKWQSYGTWESATAASVLKEGGIHTHRTYIYKLQATVAKWVVLRPILEVCDMETVY